MKYLAPVSLMIVALFAFIIAGCGSGPTEPAGSATPAVSSGAANHDHDDHAQHSDDGQTDMQMMKAELAKLSKEDAAAAEKQHMCPVSGEMLGTMGAPLKIDVNGQQVWICCGGCKEQLLENPDEYLAKLNTK